MPGPSDAKVPATFAAGLRPSLQGECNLSDPAVHRPETVLQLPPSVIGPAVRHTNPLASGSSKPAAGQTNRYSGVPVTFTLPQNNPTKPCPTHNSARHTTIEVMSLDSQWQFPVNRSTVRRNASNGEHQRGVFSVNCRTGISWPYNFRAISSLSLCVDIGPFSARTCRMIQSRDHWKICSARATLTCIGIASICSSFFR